MTALPDHEFWRYSLKLYEKQHVKDLCLDLQERYQVNINLLLYCCWFSNTGRGVIGVNNIEVILNNLEAWNKKITKGLRRIRNRLKQFPELDWAQTIRQEVLKQELVSEQIEQLIIASTVVNDFKNVRTPQQKANDAIVNLNDYFSVINKKPDRHAYSQLQTLLAAVFPTVVKDDLPQIGMLI